MDATVQQNQQEGLPIFKNRNFILLFIGSLFSAPGYYVYLIGAEWLMLSLDDNRFYFGMLFFAASVPRLLLLTVGGIVADRFNKRTILFISDFTRAILIFVLLLFLFMDAVTVWHLIVLAALFGISDAFSYPVINSLTPMILEKEQLQRGNSLIQMTTQISPILGPALGGTLIALLGFKGVFSVAFVMLLIASLTVLFMRLKQADATGEKKTPLEDLKEGFSYARKNELIMSIVFTAFFLNFFFTGPFSIGMPIIVKDIFAGNAISLATVQTAMGIGALIGAIFLASIKLKKQGLTVIISLIVLGVIYTSIGMSSYLYLTAGLVASLAFLLQLVNIPIMTILQKSTEKRMLGRMMSLLMTVSTGLVPISYVITSLLIAVGVSIQTIIIVSGIVVMFIAIYNLKNKKLRTLISS
ncbi:MAG: MFS transporter [Bacillota bacterium]|uniref:MFS transporter n=1 Tax=Virgibacillus salarius TaxID=447199 RepID=A0A941IC68_9BACI|nr:MULTISPECIES: MFS transporter [Bacillaceae]MBR7797087.1 MFS transporter [Virgibacillus salarius]MDY7044905.1 MFS transporter [Virgibacillus sp. M23]NAZ09796.1 MFS transporter [Agaribacter marinus]